MKNNKHTSHSFSLFELTISMSIILILVSLTVPKLFNFTHYHLAYELDHLFVVFSYLQHKTVASNRSRTAVFDLKNNSYSFPGVNDNPCTHTLARTLFFGSLPLVKGTPGNPKKYITKPITFSYKKDIPTALFLPDGKISPGTIYIAAKHKKIMGALTCSLSQISFLRQYFYVGKKWRSA